MNARLVRLAAVVFCLGFLPNPAVAQCKNQQDQHCWNLQYILYAAQTDFRELRGLKAPHLDASLGAVQVPCDTDAWLNNVAMFRCQAELSPLDADQWYAKTMADLRQLQYLWQFRVESSGADRYVDAGPPDCEIAPQNGGYITDGPYRGQCPLHLQTVRQTDGSDEVFLWVTSYSSAYLERNPFVSPAMGLQLASKTESPEAAAPLHRSTSPEATEPPVLSASSARSPASSSPTMETAAHRSSIAPSRSEEVICDELCQGLKKVLDDRRTAFKLLHSGPGAKNSSGADSSTVTLRLFGSSNCSVNSVTSPEMRYPSTSEGSRVDVRSTTSRAAVASPVLQYVCYWPENSASAAQSQFRGLISLLQTIIPSYWSAQEQDQTDELSGAKVTVWSVQDSTRKPVVRLYLSGESVGLHVHASD